MRSDAPARRRRMRAPRVSSATCCPAFGNPPSIPTGSEIALRSRPNAGDYAGHYNVGRGRDGFLQRLLTAAIRGRGPGCAQTRYPAGVIEVPLLSSSQKGAQRTASLRRDASYPSDIRDEERFGINSQAALFPVPAPKRTAIVNLSQQPKSYCWIRPAHRPATRHRT